MGGDMRKAIADAEERDREEPKDLTAVWSTTAWVGKYAKEINVDPERLRWGIGTGFSNDAATVQLIMWLRGKCHADQSYCQSASWDLLTALELPQLVEGPA